jgi:hypothetical protein
VFRRVTTGVVVALTVACASAAFAYRAAYGTFAWWRQPAHISWCGRHYLPSKGPTLTRSAVEQQRANLAGDAPFPVVTVTRLPPLVGRPGLASVTPEASRHRLRLPCATTVYLETDPDAYRPYVLSGGP